MSIQKDNYLYYGYCVLVKIDHKSLFRLWQAPVSWSLQPCYFLPRLDSEKHTIKTVFGSYTLHTQFKEVREMKVRISVANSWPFANIRTWLFLKIFEQFSICFRRLLDICYTVEIQNVVIWRYIWNWKKYKVKGLEDRLLGNGNDKKGGNKSIIIGLAKGVQDIYGYELKSIEKLKLR